MAEISRSLEATERFILAENYHGYDPFDALTSPIFALPFFRSNRLLRLGAQQIVKRSPINFRQLLGIRKGYNPVTLALCLQAFAYLREVFPNKAVVYDEHIAYCLRELQRLRSAGYSGACWGYDFDWEARYARIPAFTPTVVATGFVTNALFEYYRHSGNETAYKLCRSAVDFVRKDLNRIEGQDGFCYSYSPRDRQVVFNATMKGARLLAQVYSVSGDSGLAEEARRTIAFVMQHQRQAGAWSYAHGDARQWVDNFHTAYVLDALKTYVEATGDDSFASNLKRGLEFYTGAFFTREGVAKYYDKSVYPVDATAAAQSILTLLRFGYFEKALAVVRWMVRHMQAPSGYFYYQRHRLYTNRIPYMRWSTAWMFLALAYLMYKATFDR